MAGGNDVQTPVLERVFDAVSRILPGRDTEEASLRAVLRGAGRGEGAYATTLEAWTQGAMAPFQDTLVSLPVSVSSTYCVAETLTGRDTRVSRKGANAPCARVSSVVA